MSLNIIRHSLNLLNEMWLSQLSVVILPRITEFIWLSDNFQFLAFIKQELLQAKVQNCEEEKNQISIIASVLILLIMYNYVCIVCLLYEINMFKLKLRL